MPPALACLGEQGERQRVTAAERGQPVTQVLRHPEPAE